MTFAMGMGLSLCTPHSCAHFGSMWKMLSCTVVLRCLMLVRLPGEDIPLFGAYLQVCGIPNASQLHSIPRGTSLLALAAHLPHVDEDALVRLARATSQME
eukprot:CAMPEP_0113921422 /NCGR_PEP_ID=MMETSP1159-20121227/1077_1 /TAXON_ID=88271 /ORGANISM="Picocystis salinarum" /LENGTH=99 /DNA_ID=CAMNT_0000921475 /DNA_START=21 /DNA_END=320 /DNA_ORIENTATION=- /assembly_acc=CAM_ASM_000767